MSVAEQIDEIYNVLKSQEITKDSVFYSFGLNQKVAIPKGSYDGSATIVILPKRVFKTDAASTSAGTELLLSFNQLDTDGFTWNQAGNSYVVKVSGSYTFSGTLRSDGSYGGYVGGNAIILKNGEEVHSWNAIVSSSASDISTTLQLEKDDVIQIKIIGKVYYTTVSQTGYGTPHISELTCDYVE